MLEVHSMFCQVISALQGVKNTKREFMMCTSSLIWICYSDQGKFTLLHLQCTFCAFRAVVFCLLYTVVKHTNTRSKKDGSKRRRTQSQTKWMIKRQLQLKKKRRANMLRFSPVVGVPWRSR